MNQLIGLKIGTGNWLATINNFGETLRRDFWSKFKQSTLSEIKECEKRLNRRLPDDFTEFLQARGSGPFGGRVYGGISSPADIILECTGPICMLVPGASQIQEELVRNFYQSQGTFNPDPSVLTNTAMIHSGISLFDVIQIGWDGSAGYHQLTVDRTKYGFGYFVLTEDNQIEHKQPDFSAALVSILTRVSKEQESLEERS